MLRQTLILSIAIFLSMAPEPDAQDIAGMSASFLLMENHAPLLADVNDSKYIHSGQRIEDYTLD